MTDKTNFAPDRVRERIEPRDEVLRDLNRGLEILKKFKPLFKSENHARVDTTIQAIETAQSKNETIKLAELLTLLPLARETIENKLRELNKADREHKLVDLYRAGLADGTVPKEFNINARGEYSSERDAARAWGDNLVHTALDIGKILKTLEKNSKKAGDRELILPPEATPVIPTPTPEAPRPAPETPRAPTRSETPAPEAREESEEHAEVAEPDTDDINPPNTPAFLIDISEIVKRLATRQAEEKLNEFLNKPIVPKKSEEEKAQITEERQKKGFFGRLFSRTKEAAKTTLEGVKNFGQKIYVRLSEKQYYNKFYQEALAEIQKNKNLMTEIEARIIRRSISKEISPDRSDRHLQVIDEVINTYKEGVSETEERGEKINDPQVNAELSVLFYRYATGELTNRKAFDEEVENKVINRFFAKDATEKKDVKFTSEEDRKKSAEGLMFANNFFEMAKTYKKYIEHKIKEAVERFGPENKEAIEGHVRALLALDIQLGLKERDIRDTRPAQVLSFFDKMIDKAQSIPVLGKALASPTAWGAGTAAAVVLAVRGGIGLPLRALAGAPGIGAIFGGVIGGARRGRDLQYDRGLELRRKALGLEPGGERSAKMREYTQSMMDIDRAIAQMQVLEKKQKSEWTETEKRFVANIYARLGLEKQTQFDLFVAQKGEADQTATRVASMNNLKIALRRLTETSKILDTAMQQLVTEEGDKILIELERVDDKFKAFRRKEIVKAGVFGAVVGCVAGAAAEAGIMAIKGEYSQSCLGRLQEYLYGHSHTGDAVVPVVLPQKTTTIIGEKIIAHQRIVDGGQLFSDKLHEVQIPGIKDVSLKIPEELSLLPDGQGAYMFVDQNGLPVMQGIEFTPQGRFTNETLSTLKQFGWGLKENVQTQEVKLTDPKAMLEYMRQNFGREGHGAVYGNRVYHGNIDVPSRQPTELDNPFFQGKYQRTGHFPYEYKADEGVAEASQKSAQEGILDKPVSSGETVRGRMFEGKELRGILTHKNGEHVFSFRKGIMDMFKHGKMNWDGSVDQKFRTIKHLIESAHGNMAKASEHFSIRFYLNSPDFIANEAFAVPLGPDGQLHIPKGSELERILFDQKTGKLLATWEVSCDVPHDDHITPHALATKRAHGAVTEILTQKTTITEELISPQAPDKIVVDYTTEPVITTITEPTPVPLPPEVPEEVPPWMIPIPFNPRKAMEGPKRSPIIMPPYGYYGTGGYGERGLTNLGWENDEQRYSNFSETVKRNPEAKLDEAKEIRAYFDRMDPKEKDFIFDMDEELDDAMSQNCRVAITVPAYKEEKHIGRTLEMFAKQKDKNGSPLNPELYEIIVFENSKKIEDKDRTEEIVRNFAASHPEMKIKYIYRQLPPDSTIGAIRKHMCDLEILRAQKRKNKTGDLILVHNDADTYGITENYVESIANLFDSHPEADAFGGRNEWPKEAFDKLPLFYAAKRFDQLLDIFFRTIQEKHPSMIGRNSGQRASNYAAVGGFNPRCTLGEDLEMQRKIQHARNWKVVEEIPNPRYGDKDKRQTLRKNRIRFLNNSYVESDPRRPIMKILKDSLGDEYGDWVQNDEVRGADWKDIIDKFPQFKDRLQFNKENLQKQLQAILNKWLAYPWVNRNQLRNFTERSFNLLGIDAELAGKNQDQIKVKSTAKLEAGMSNIRRSGSTGKHSYAIGRKA